MARGRKKLELNKDELQKVITELENNNVFANYGELLVAVEATDWAKNMSPRPLKAPVVYQRIKELNIACHTKPGKRGNVNLRKSTTDGQPVVRVTRGEKNKKFSSSFAAMKAEFPDKYHSVIDKAQAGSLKATNKLMCLSCTNFQVLEVKNCTCISCPLYPVRFTK